MSARGGFARTGPERARAAQAKAAANMRNARNEIRQEWDRAGFSPADTAAWWRLRVRCAGCAVDLCRAEVYLEQAALEVRDPRAIATTATIARLYCERAITIERARELAREHDDQADYQGDPAPGPRAGDGDDGGD